MTGTHRRPRKNKANSWGWRPTAIPGRFCQTKPIRSGPRGRSGAGRAKRTQFACAAARVRPTNSAKQSQFRQVTHRDSEDDYTNKTRPTKVRFDRTDPRYRPGNAGRNPPRRLLSCASNKANLRGRRHPVRAAPGNACDSYFVDTTAVRGLRWAIDLSVNPQHAVRPISRTWVPCLRLGVDMSGLTVRTRLRERRHSTPGMISPGERYGHG